MKAGDRQGLENIAQYLIRNAFSLVKLMDSAETRKVLYRSKVEHGRNKRNVELFSALEFIG